MDYAFENNNKNLLKVLVPLVDLNKPLVTVVGSSYFLPYLIQSDIFEIVKHIIEKKYIELLDCPAFYYGANVNYIDNIKPDIRKRLVEENIIQVRNCGYIIKYLQEEQTVEM